MNRIPPKNPRRQLAPNLYEHLRQQVLRRDGWRCQSCGAMSNLEVHHKELRSQSGDDSEQNLITLCVACHSLVHRGRNGQSSSRPGYYSQTARSTSRELSVTVSIGVAEPSAKVQEVELVIQAADKALYRAKQTGRNRVESATTLRARGSRLTKRSPAIF